MRKYEQQDEKIVVIYTKEQLDLLEERMADYPDEESFLVAVGAIQYIKYPRYPIEIRSVTRIDALKGTSEPITGCMYDTDIPYLLYRKLIDAVIRRSKSRDFAKQKL